MIAAAGFAVLAAAGTLARTFAGRRWNRDELPLGTLSVNWLGSLGLGLLASADPLVATLVGTAALGALTTFSSFVRDTIALAEQGRPGRAVGYVVLSCSGAVAGAWLGLAMVA